MNQLIKSSLPWKEDVPNKHAHLRPYPKRRIDHNDGPTCKEKNKDENPTVRKEQTSQIQAVQQPTVEPLAFLPFSVLSLRERMPLNMHAWEISWNMDPQET